MQGLSHVHALGASRAHAFLVIVLAMTTVGR